MLRREKDMYIVMDSIGGQFRTRNLTKALKREHFVNLSNKKYDKDNKTLLKEVRGNKRELKKLYEKKRLNDTQGE